MIANRTTGILILMALMCSAAVAVTQAGTILIGIVTDPQGATVSLAQVNVYPQGASSPLRTQTDNEGRYEIALPAGGMFVVEVMAEGFRNSSKAITVSGGARAQSDVSLEIAGVSSSVVVTASAAAQTVDQISKAVSVIGMEEILNRGETSLPGILSTVPGLQVRTGGGPGQFVSVRTRGLRPDATAVLVDGMRFRDAASPQTDAAAFMSNLNFVGADRIEVLKGSGSSLYGSNAAGGVVNIVTDEGGSPVHGTIQGEGGNLGLGRGRVQIGGGALNDRFRYSGGVMHLNVTRGVDGNDATRSTGGQGFLRYDLSSATNLSFRYFGSDDFVQLNTGPTTTGIPAANFPSAGTIEAVPLPQDQVDRLTAGQSVAYGAATYIPNIDDPDNHRASRYNVTAIKLEHFFSSTASFQSSYQTVRTWRVFDNGPGGRGFQPSVRNYGRYAGKTDIIDARSNVQPAGWSQLTFGYEFEREGYDDLLDNFEAGPVRVKSQASIRQHSHAAYFQNQLGFLNNQLQVSLSGRAQVFRLERPFFDVTGVTTKYDTIDLSAPPKALTGDGSLSYFVSSTGTKFRIHAGNSYRSPGLYERFGGGFYRSNDAVIFSPYGDPFLAPDRYNSIDGGIDQYLAGTRVRVSATYFYSRVVSATAFDNGVQINLATDPYGRSFGYINGSGAISRGLELNVESRPTPNMTFSGSYSYTRTNTDRDVQIPGFFGGTLTPRHTFSLVASQQIGRRFNVSADLSSQASLIYPYFFAATRTAPFRFEGTTKTDVSLSYDLTRTDSSSVKLYTRIENVFNRTYYDSGNLVPKAAVVAGLMYRF